MHPLNDKDLDRLSRNAAEHFDPEPSVSGWEQLQQRLDQEMPAPEKKRRRGFLLWFLLLALTGGAGITWLLTGTGNDKSLTAKPATTTVGNTAPTPATHTLPSSNNSQTTTEQQLPAGPNIDPSTNTVTHIPATSQPGTEANDVATDRKVTGSNNRTTRAATATPAPFTSNERINKGNSRLPANKRVTPKNIYTATHLPQQKNTAWPLNDVAGNEAVKTDARNNPTPAEGSGLSQKELVASMPAMASLPAHNITIAAPALMNIDSTGKKIAQAPEKAGREAGFELGLVAGPDFSNVKFKYADKTGINAGLQVAYRLNKHWSFNTGLLYTKKFYTAKGEDFNPPKHYWTYYVDLDKVQGNCMMWEIPVNIRYDLSAGSKRRYFLSTGLSTYLMKVEDYDYHYLRNGSYTVSSRKIDSSSNYFLSTLNLSAGFERTISSHLSVQVEPYLKLPLKGVGLGSLQVNSYGIYFSMRYKLK